MRELCKKTLFTISIQSKTDVVTNSSSELFVVDSGNSKEDVIGLLDVTLPDWRTEYVPPKHLSEIDQEELEEYMRYWSYRQRPEITGIFEFANRYYPEKSFEEAIQLIDRSSPEMKEFMKEWIEGEEERDRLEKYIWKRPLKFWAERHGLADDIIELGTWRSREGDEKEYESGLTEKGFKLAKELLSKENPNMYFIYSGDQNPDWEGQERLSKIATRYHLG